jgi:hypothetical protein
VLDEIAAQKEALTSVSDENIDFLSHYNNIFYICNNSIIQQISYKIN